MKTEYETWRDELAGRRDTSGRIWLLGAVAGLAFACLVMEMAHGWA